MNTPNLPQPDVDTELTQPQARMVRQVSGLQHTNGCSVAEAQQRLAKAGQLLAKLAAQGVTFDPDGTMQVGPPPPFKPVFPAHVAYLAAIGVQRRALQARQAAAIAAEEAASSRAMHHLLQMRALRRISAPPPGTMYWLAVTLSIGLAAACRALLG